MKTFIHLLAFTWLSFCFALMVASCDENPTAPTNTDLLTQPTWRLVSLKVDGADQPTTGYSLRFTKTAEGAGNYTATGQLFTFPSSGTWAFNTGATAILLNGGPAQIRIVSLQQNTMTLTVTVTTPKNGDVEIELVFGK